MSPETLLSKSIRDVLKMAGFWVIRLQVTGARGARSMATGERGLPDLYLPGLGHMEVKVPGKKPSPDQVTWHEKARSNGVRVGVVTSPAEALQLAHEWRSEIHRAADTSAAQRQPGPGD